MSNTTGVQPHRCIPSNAPKFREWITSRGGVAVWDSINLSNPGASWSSPALALDGSPTTKPTWQAADKPSRIITDPAEILVDLPVEVKRFHVAVRRSSQGLSYKLTDASSRKVEAATAKAGPEAWYEFDYGSQEAVIYKPGRSIPLSEWRIELTQTPADIFAAASTAVSQEWISVEGYPHQVSPGWIIRRAEMHLSGSFQSSGNSTWVFDPEAKGDPVNRTEVK